MLQERVAGAWQYQSRFHIKHSCSIPCVLSAVPSKQDIFMHVLVMMCNALLLTPARVFLQANRIYSRAFNCFIICLSIPSSPALPSFLFLPLISFGLGCF